MSQFAGKDAETKKAWRQEEVGVTEDEMVGWHHRRNGHEFKQMPEDSEGQSSLARFGPWSLKESDTTYWLNNNNLMIKLISNLDYW